MSYSFILYRAARGEEMAFSFSRKRRKKKVPLSSKRKGGYLFLASEKRKN